MTLARNAAFNLMGAALPAALSLLTIPYIVHSLGTDDFGLLTLVTAIVGYFALLDVNLTAGSTKYVSQFQAVGDHRQLQQTVCFGLMIYAVIGALGMVGLYLFAQPLVRGVFSVPANRQVTGIAAVQVAALGFAIGQIQAYLQSLPGAMMRFDISGRIEAVFGTAVPLLTVALLSQGMGLVELVMLRVVASALQVGVLVWALGRLMPGFKLGWPQPDLRAKLLGFSAYAFLSKLATLTYAHADKLLIGNRVSVTAVAYFSVPSTLANRVMGLVFRLSGVMFPHASALAAAGRIDELRRHYLLGSRYLFFINGGIALLLAALAEPLLRLWMGSEFADRGAQVMVLVALAQWVDSLTNLPSLVNDGLGHPRVSGGFALIRALVGLLMIVVGVNFYGIVGAASAHLVASVVMSAAFLLYVHGRTVPVRLTDLVRQGFAGPLAVLVPLGLLSVLLAPWAVTWQRLCGLILLLFLFGLAAGWLVVLVPGHRQQVLRRLGRQSAT